MILDLLIAITATAGAAIVIAALSLSIPAPASGRIGIAAVLTAWFFVAVALAATGAVGPAGLGTPGVGIAVVLPIVVIAILAPRWAILRNALYGIPIPILIGVNAVRVFGYFFIIHYAAGRLAGSVRSERRMGRCPCRRHRDSSGLDGRLGRRPAGVRLLSSGTWSGLSTWSWRSASA